MDKIHEFMESYMENVIIKEEVDDPYYKYEGQQKITLFGKVYKVNVTIVSDNKPMQQAQLKAFSTFSQNSDKLFKALEKPMMNYINTEVQSKFNGTNSSQDFDIPKVSTVDEMSKYIHISRVSEVFITRAGEILMHVECDWDEEHGTGIILYPSVKVISPDDLWHRIGQNYIHKKLFRGSK